MLDAKDMTYVFHSQNHTRVKRYGVCGIRDYKMLSETFSGPGTYRFKNKSAGLYFLKTSGKCYMINLFTTLSGKDTLVVESSTSIYAVIDNKKKYIIPYEVTAEFSNNSLSATLETKLSSALPVTSVEIENSINDYLDVLAVSGKTILSKDNQSPYNPVDITSISSFDVTSTGSKPEEKSIVTINLMDNIKQLPSGISDLFIMDNNRKQAYVIYRVGRTVFTGNEHWVASELNKKYCIFFLPYSRVSTGSDDNSVNCNYLPCMTNTNMKDNKTVTYGISNSNSNDNPGFYIRIPTDLLESVSLDGFKNYLRQLMKNKKPMIVEYLLKTSLFKTILLDTYEIKQYFPKTTISINVNSNAGFFFKALDYKAK